MRNRSAIWVFTILLFFACLYQLSFSWVTRSFESDVNDQAVGKFDSLTQNAIPYFTLNGDTLIVDGNSKKEKLQMCNKIKAKQKGA